MEFYGPNPNSQNKIHVHQVHWRSSIERFMSQKYDCDIGFDGSKLTASSSELTTIVILACRISFASMSIAQCID